MSQTAPSPTAVITGVTGQDGWHLAEQLLARGYRVIGVTRRSSVDVVVPAGVTAIQWDWRDDSLLRAVLTSEQPREFYNLAAFSTGAGMFDDPVAMGDVNGLAVARILEAIRQVSPATRFCQASSAEMYGMASGSPQDETTRFDPRSPYGVAKLYAHHLVGLYRQEFGIFATSAILFNHESPRRGERFVTGKIARAAAAIRLGLSDHLVLGDLSANRDWGFAGDYVHAMWLMLQHDTPGDYVVATGRTHSVADFCRLAFASVGLDYRDYVRSDPALVRKSLPLQLVGDAHKAQRELGWRAEMTFECLVATMVNAELQRLTSQQV